MSTSVVMERSAEASPRFEDIMLVFFGLHFVVIGDLIFRSTFLPRILGVLVAFAGFGG